MYIARHRASYFFIYTHPCGCGAFTVAKRLCHQVNTAKYPRSTGIKKLTAVNKQGELLRPALKTFPQQNILHYNMISFTVCLHNTNIANNSSFATVKALYYGYAASLFDEGENERYYFFCRTLLCHVLRVYTMIYVKRNKKKSGEEELYG